MKRYLGIAAIAALVLVFGAAGLTKLVAAALFAEQFAHFGLPHWWIYVTGGVELVSALLIAFTKGLPRRFGAATLAATMAVATALHVTHDPIGQALPALMLMLLAGYVASMPRPGAAAPGLAGA